MGSLISKRNVESSMKSTLRKARSVRGNFSIKQCAYNEIMRGMLFCGSTSNRYSLCLYKLANDSSIKSIKIEEVVNFKSKNFYQNKKRFDSVRLCTSYVTSILNNIDSCDVSDSLSSSIGASVFYGHTLLTDVEEFREFMDRIDRGGVSLTKSNFPVYFNDFLNYGL